ncbi:MAG: hypothetical protein J7K88_11495 [Candidatus Fermentibacteraceae bacterium]|nr:hypothetical protein [Candidatus Fermentibacteraceae bacterium]
MSDSFVDLLLVRLGREEEKKKVLKLLITSLDLSVTEAENAVNNSPSVIKEAVPMNEARVIQKDLYPYIDLLPRLEDEAGISEESPSGVVLDSSGGTVNPEGTEAEPGVETTEKPGDAQSEETVQQPAVEEEEEEPIVITSASEEILSTARCHICGRTPTDGERLAPCRTCGQLTCRNCFDRVAHVCSHCARDGKSVDRPNKGVTAENREGLEFDTEQPVSEKTGAGSTVLKTVVAVFLVLALAAVFYFIDPLNLFSTVTGNSTSNTGLVSADTSGVSGQDSISTGITTSPDSTDIDGVPADTLSVKSDSLAVEDPFGLRFIVLPDSCIPAENPVSISFQTRAPRNTDAEVSVESSEVVFSKLELLASAIPIVVDDGAFLVYEDSTTVVVMVILHPEEAEVRIRLMRDAAAMLEPADIDQLVLIYRENRYQEAVVYSLVHEAFSEVAGILSPRQFQNIMGYRESCWESVSGPVALWLSAIE